MKQAKRFVCLFLGCALVFWGAPDPGREEVSVCLQVDIPVSHDVLAWTQITAARIFGHIGLRLRWTCGEQAVVTMIRGSRTGDPDHALGFALPFSHGGVRATILYDRAGLLTAGLSSASSGVLLGHVVAHELGHVLLGVDSHAGSGLMRARWTLADLENMRMGPLAFTPEDAQSIRQNLSSLGQDGARGD